jgi:hypothetical protein
MKLWQVHALVDMEITWLQTMLKVVSVYLDIQADTALHIHECCSQYGRMDCSNCRNGTNWVGRHQVSVAKFHLLQ